MGQATTRFCAHLEACRTQYSRNTQNLLLQQHGKFGCYVCPRVQVVQASQDVSHLLKRHFDIRFVQLTIRKGPKNHCKVAKTRPSLMTKYIG